MSPASGDAEIRDVRYSRYDGERRGAMSGIVSLARWGALRSLGARRGWKAKAVPITLALLAVAPAIIVLGVRALFAEQSGIDLSDALPFSDYQAIIGIVILLFAGITTPELLCPDRRDGTLSLYFSTAVSRNEYLAGRILAAVVPLLLVTLVPLLVLYGGILVFELHPVAYLQENWGQLPRIIAAGLILAVYYGLVGLAVASLTGRRAFAIGGYLLVLIAPTLVAELIGEALGDPDWPYLLYLSVLPINFAASLFPGTEEIPNSTAAWAGAYLVVVGLAAAVLLRRYRPGAEG